MKKILLLTTLVICLMSFNSVAQKYGTEPREKFGTTLNVGAGVGYYGYVGHAAPIVMLNLEFDIARNVTLAPFIGFYSYSSSYYWGNPNYPYRYYSYRETSIPLGVKGAYYFDELLHASPKWDFYAAASVGFAFHKVTWDNGYYGERDVVRESSPLYGAGHIGARLHVTPKFGLYLDLSTGFSTFGLSFKF